jgi:hypothetical protein
MDHGEDGDMTNTMLSNNPVHNLKVFTDSNQMFDKPVKSN